MSCGYKWFGCTKKPNHMQPEFLNIIYYVLDFSVKLLNHWMKTILNLKKHVIINITDFVFNIMM